MIFLILLNLLVGLWVVTTQFGHTFLGFVLLGISCVLLCYYLFQKYEGRKSVRILRRIFTSVLAAGILAASITGGFIISDAFGDAGEDLDYIVVLGAGVNGTEPSLSLRDRLTAALSYLETHPDTICIVSGCRGYNEEISEAECMYTYLTKHGIDPNRVWMEDQAENTRENIQYTLDLIEEKTGMRPTQLGIVSSEYHIFRAKQFAKEFNVIPYGIPGKTSWITLKINYFLREIAAVWYYSIFGG